MLSSYLVITICHSNLRKKLNVRLRHRHDKLQYDQLLLLNDYLWISKNNLLRKAAAISNIYRWQWILTQVKRGEGSTIISTTISYFVNMNSNIKWAIYKNSNENMQELTRIINRMCINTSSYVMMSIRFVILCCRDT